MVSGVWRIREEDDEQREVEKEDTESLTPRPR